MTIQIPLPGNMAFDPMGKPAGAQVGGIYPAIMAQLAPAMMQTHWQGPFPPPEAVERFEHVQPGTFNRILIMAENLQAAQIKQSGSALSLHHGDVARAQWLAFGGMLGSMCGAGISIYLGHDVIAGIFLAMPVMGVLKALIDSARARTQSPETAEAHVAPAGAPSAHAKPEAQAQAPK